MAKTTEKASGWRGPFTCVGWQVTMCDPVWQVTLRSSVIGFQSIELHAPLPLQRRTLCSLFVFSVVCNFQWAKRPAAKGETS